MKFTEADVAPFALGSAVLGGGGGGDPYLAEVLLREQLRAAGPVEILRIDDLHEDMRIAPFALIGSPLVASEFMFGEALLRAPIARATEHSEPVQAVIPLEMAGINALIPIAVASLLGLPCVDGDFTGRGVPSVDMTTMAIDPPLRVKHVLSDVLGRSMVFDPPSGYGFEALMRPLIDTLGSLASYSTSPLSAESIRQRALPGTLSSCLQVGKVFAQLSAHRGAHVNDQLAQIGGKLIATGSIVERIATRDEAGHRAAIVIEGEGSSAAGDAQSPQGRVLTRVDLRAEFHVVSQDGSVRATAPDLIVIVDLETLEPMTVDQAVPGLDVAVLVLPAHERSVSPAGLQLTGPSPLGYQVDYVPFIERGWSE